MIKKYRLYLAWLTELRRRGGVLPLLLLTACGGGGGGLASGGQDPDPVAVDLPIAYIQRPLRNKDDEAYIARTDDRLGFHPPASLYLKSRATEQATSVNLTADSFASDAAIDIKDLSVSADGERLLFALHAPNIKDADPEDQPTWNIWEYDLKLGAAHRIISSDITAHAGDDITPRYLPNGRIVFASTRQVRSRAILLDDNKPQYAAQSEAGDGPALVLHSMNADGTDIRQLTYNQGHDWDPLVLPDGRLLYTRSDNFANNRQSYYTANPDGTNVRPYYGYNSRNVKDVPWLFNPELLPDGRLVGIYKPRDKLTGGDMLAIDTAHYTEDSRTLAGETDTDGALQSQTLLPVTIDGDVSRHGLFSALTPLYDGTHRLLVSWSQCRLTAADSSADNPRYIPCSADKIAQKLEPAPPLYGIWTYNLDTHLQRPVVVPREGVIYTDLATLEPHTAPDYIAPDIDSALADKGLGVLDIRSVYDSDGKDTSGPGIDVLRDPAQTTAAQRPARFLRLIKAVSLPPREVLDFPGSAFGASRAQGMKEILGYVPIEPDGSVKTLVPADIAFTLAVVDASGKRIGPRHQNWLQVRPGETFKCQGCHQRGSPVPHGRLDAQPESINSGAPTTGQPFANTEPALFTDMGETMAQVYARIGGIREPSVNISYHDDWTDPTVRAKDADFAYTYQDLSAVPNPAQVPTTDACQSAWGPGCRIIINYPTHIQPLWEKSRPVLDATNTVIADNRCVSCHAPNNASALAQIPAGQLDLTSAVNNSPFIMSYQQLLQGRFEQALVDGVLQDKLVATGDYQTDENGELILDDQGDPIPILEPVPLKRLMATAGAAASDGFFTRFKHFDPAQETVDHRGMLNPSELKLLAEWLDIGAQYYNNPFDVPD